MLRYTDPDACQLSSSNRHGQPQYNAVSETLGEVLMRGDPAELNGFCAALTDIAASADESGDYYRFLAKRADWRERIMRRVAKRREARVVRS